MKFFNGLTVLGPYALFEQSLVFVEDSQKNLYLFSRPLLFNEKISTVFGHTKVDFLPTFEGVNISVYECESVVV